MAHARQRHQFGPAVEAVPFDPSDPERGTVLGVSYPTRDVTENVRRS